MTPISARSFNERTVIRPDKSPELEVGVVGWPGNDDICSIGTEDNDGRTLVRVTLYRGATPGDEPAPGEAAGYQVTVRTSGPLYHVPPKGTEVIVAFPGGFGMAPGSGVLLASVGPTPGIQFRGNKAKLDVGPDQDIVIKGRSVTISDYDNRYLAVGPDTGTMMADEDGTMMQIKDRQITIVVPGDDGVGKAVLLLNVDAIMMVHAAAAGTSVVNMADGNMLATGQQGSLIFGSVNIGSAASPVTAAVVAPVGAPGIAGVGSSSVFISP